MIEDDPVTRIDEGALAANPGPRLSGLERRPQGLVLSGIGLFLQALALDRPALAVTVAGKPDESAAQGEEVVAQRVRVDLLIRQT